MRYDFIKITAEKTLNPVIQSQTEFYNNNPPNQQVLWDSTDTNNSSYSANLGFIYSLFSSLDLTLGLGSSFRSPSLEERFPYMDQGSVVRVGNPDLEPEKGQSIDFGVRHYLDNFKIVSSFSILNLTIWLLKSPVPRRTKCIDQNQYW